MSTESYPASETYDAAVIGGGAAGLAAAMVLARARRSVIVIDDGKQSNLVSSASHGVFAHDGTKPAALYQKAREELRRYPTMTFEDDRVTAITRSRKDMFQVTTVNKLAITAKTILFAQGVNYNLPNVDGIEDLWGSDAWHCPYCDGYESADKKLLVIGSEEWLEHMQLSLRSWSNDATFLHPNKVTKLTKVDDKITAILENGRSITFDKVVVETTPSPRDTLADSLGCERESNGNLVIKQNSRTSADGVYAAGDQASEVAQVNVAVASGHMAGVNIDMYLSEKP